MSSDQLRKGGAATLSATPAAQLEAERLQASRVNSELASVQAARQAAEGELAVEQQKLAAAQIARTRAQGEQAAEEKRAAIALSSARNALETAQRAETERAASLARTAAARAREDTGEERERGGGCVTAVAKLVFFLVLVAFAGVGVYHLALEPLFEGAPLLPVAGVQKAESKEVELPPIAVTLAAIAADDSEVCFAAYAACCYEHAPKQKFYASEWKRLRTWLVDSALPSVPAEDVVAERKRLLALLELKQDSWGALTPITDKDSNPSEFGAEALALLRKLYKP